MSKLAFELLRKNPRLDIILMGNKSSKTTLAKLKLLSGVCYKSYIESLTEGFKPNKDKVFHTVINADLLVPAVTELSKRNTLVFNQFNEPNLCFDFVGLPKGSLGMLFEQIRPILKHPAIVLSTDNDDSLISIMGICYTLTDVEGITKAFCTANSLYSLHGENKYKL